MAKFTVFVENDDLTELLNKVMYRVNSVEWQGHPARGLLVTQYQLDQGGVTFMIQAVNPERTWAVSEEKKISNYLEFDPAVFGETVLKPIT